MMNILAKMLRLVALPCLGATIALAYVWYKDPTGNYEPITVMLGAATALSEFGRRALTKIANRKVDAISSAEEILQYREKMRNEFEEHLGEWIRERHHGRLLIRDIARIDNYPQSEPTIGRIAPWFGTEFKGLYDKGVEVFNSVVKVVPVPDSDDWRFCRETDEDAETAYVVVRIPYEKIRKVLWNGDQIYSEPHLFCIFDGMFGTPYSEGLIYQERGTEPNKYFHELCDLETAKRLTREFRKVMV